MQHLPPSVTVSPTAIGISVLTEAGATVQVSLPRPKGLHDLSEEEIADKALRMARTALETAADRLPE